MLQNFAFPTSIGISVAVVTEIAGVPLRGIYLLELDLQLIANSEPISLHGPYESVDAANWVAMGMCNEIEDMALEIGGK